MTPGHVSDTPVIPGTQRSVKFLSCVYHHFPQRGDMLEVVAKAFQLSTTSQKGKGGTSAQ